MLQAEVEAEAERALVYDAAAALTTAVWRQMMTEPGDWAYAAPAIGRVVQSAQVEVAKTAVRHVETIRVQSGAPRPSIPAPRRPVGVVRSPTRPSVSLDAPRVTRARPIPTPQSPAAQAQTRPVPVQELRIAPTRVEIPVIVPEGFAQATPSGAQIEATMGTAVTEMRAALDAGADMDEALDRGESWARVIARSVLQDTYRDVAAVDVTCTEDAQWVYAPNMPCCKRCAALAGRVYAWDTEFVRHPGCDCQRRKFVGDPPGDVLSAADLVDRGLVTGLTRGESEALAEGADVNRVLNATRPRPRVQAAVRDRNRAARAEYEHQVAGGDRRSVLTPTVIHRHARSREEAVWLLRANGYIH